MKLQDTAANRAFDYSYLLKRIFKYIKPVQGRVWLGLIVAIPVGLLDGVVTLSLKPYMDLVLIKKNMLVAMLIPFGIVLFAALQGGLRYLNAYLTTWCGQKITNAIKIDLFAKLVEMDAKFYDENTSGLILTRYLNDPDVASKAVIEAAKAFITATFGALGLIAVMLYSSWKLAIVGVLVLLIAFLPVAILRKRIKKVSNASMVVGGGITTNYNETCGGNKIINSYNLAERQKKIFKEQIRQSFDLVMSLTKRVEWMSPLMYLIASVGIATVMGYGTSLILSGQMSSGAFMSFVASLILLYKPVKTLGNTVANIQTNFVAMGRMFELFDADSQIKENENALELSGINNNIKFNNVSFEYIEDTPVLKNINLEVNKNETIAIVGNSGGGKTTLVNLIPRFYDVKSGSIEIDEVDIRNFTLKSLKDNIAVVFQDNFLFTGTIKDNILMGKKDATDEQIARVVELAHLDEFLGTLDEGIETWIGERGATLSGGQKQRVAIARAMLKDAPIVILDEATSALDNKSEAIVQKALDNLMTNKTVFVIAHRLSTIRNANRIAVINEGVLSELGTHEQLIAIENGKYRHLFEMQFSKKEENPEEIMV